MHSPIHVLGFRSSVIYSTPGNYKCHSKWMSSCTTWSIHKYILRRQPARWENGMSSIYQKIYKHVFIIYIIPPQWVNTDGWAPSPGKTRTYLLYILNIMAADVLATQGAMALATVISTMLNRNNSAPARWGLNRTNIGRSDSTAHEATLSK